jgi:hypothetical protein
MSTVLIPTLTPHVKSYILSRLGGGNTFCVRSTKLNELVEADDLFISLWNHSQISCNCFLRVKCLLFAHYNLRTDQFDTPN